MHINDHVTPRQLQTCLVEKNVSFSYFAVYNINQQMFHATHCPE